MSEMVKRLTAEEVQGHLIEGFRCEDCDGCGWWWAKNGTVKVACESCGGDEDNAGVGLTRQGQALRAHIAALEAEIASLPIYREEILGMTERALAEMKAELQALGVREATLRVSVAAELVECAGEAQKLEAENVTLRRLLGEVQDFTVDHAVSCDALNWSSGQPGRCTCGLAEWYKAVEEATG